MAPKKKAGGKKKKADGEAKAAAETVTIPEIVVVFKPEHFVTLHIKLVTWEYLNFSERYPTSVRVFTVMERIRERHGGSILDVVLYRDKVLPKNRITDPNKTLEDAGITGGPEDANAQCVVWYDYTPHQSQCPLLLSSPRDTSGRKPMPRRSEMTSSREGVSTPAAPPSSSAADRLRSQLGSTRAGEASTTSTPRAADSKKQAQPQQQQQSQSQQQEAAPSANESSSGDKPPAAAAAAGESEEGGAGGGEGGEE